MEFFPAWMDERSIAMTEMADAICQRNPIKELKIKVDWDEELRLLIEEEKS